MKVYADTSFFISLYLGDRNGQAAVKQFESIRADGHSITVGELTALEVSNAMQLAVFRKALFFTEATKSLETFDADLNAGVFLKVPVPVTMWKTARELSPIHTGSQGCRSLDILQVAAALTLRAELFLTFDNRQRALAIAAGLNAPDLLAPRHS